MKIAHSLTTSQMRSFLLVALVAIMGLPMVVVAFSAGQTPPREWRGGSQSRGPPQEKSREGAGARGQPTDDKLVRDWKSGSTFRQPRSRRNDPWWMREEEKTNPRILPIYKPWWLDNVLVNNSWKVADLRKEAARRGMEQDISKMKKAELIELLSKSSMEYDLSDRGFRAPVFQKFQQSELPPCYPEVYEGGAANVEKLRAMSLNAAAPPAK